MNLKNCNAENFIKQLSGKKIICFGAGSTLIEADLIFYIKKRVMLMITIT